VNVGCVPKKLMYYAADANDHLGDLNDFGFPGQEKKAFQWKYVPRAISSKTIYL
jgi:pyruvate/2-oxoglutarate dehydrogenase complex dihydrolipoamide dehydrogenase (E3) component